MKLGLVALTAIAIACQLVWTNWWWVMVPLLWWCKVGESGAELAAFSAGLWLDSMMAGGTLGVSSLGLVLLVTLWKAIRNQTGSGEWWMGILGVAAMSLLSMYHGKLNILGVVVVGLVVIIVARSNFRVYRSGLRLINEKL